MTGVIAWGYFRVHTVTSQTEHGGLWRSVNESELGVTRCSSSYFLNAANNTMHRQLVVAIKTKVGHRGFDRMGVLLSDRKANKVITFRTKPGAVFGHDAGLVDGACMYA